MFNCLIKTESEMIKKLCMVLIATCLPMTLAAAEVDADAAQALMKKNGCTKCHSVDKKKVGTAYKDVAAKYKGKADAEEKLFKHLTTGPMVDVDGNKEAHKVIKAGSDDETRNLVRWILAQ